MSTIKPFTALRPVPDKAKQVSCVPYDIVHESEVRDFIKHSPISFLRVTRPEGEFDVDSTPTPQQANDRAKDNLDWFRRENIYDVDPVDAVYVYQLTSGEHRQTGVVACCSLDEYEAGTIKKHENVRPDKVRERTDHLLAVGAQTGLIFLTYRNTDKIRSLIAEAVQDEPIYNFVCLDNIAQKVWRVTDTRDWIDAFRAVPELYIADGHHRIESAKLARDVMRERKPDHNGSEDYNFVVAGIFPAEDVRILPYNRVVHDLNGLNETDFLSRVGNDFSVTRSEIKEPTKHGVMCMYLSGKWFELSLNKKDVETAGPIDDLDASILQNYILEPILGIKDPRTDDRIGFVGGRRGTAELERLVDSGSARVAFSMYPTTMDELFAISDMGEIMPPKSTWFEPKLKDGLLVHMI